METVYYVYAVTRMGEETSHPDLGIDGENAIGRVVHEGLQAIVSSVSRELFSREQLQKNMSDIAQLERMVRSHADIVRSIESGGGVVPMRFCTVCEDADDVLQFLKKHSKGIIEVLDEVKGAYEWGVKVFCDATRLQSLAEVDDGESASAVITGTSFLLKKKRTLQLKKNLSTLKIQCADECHHRLEPHAVNSQMASIQGKEITGRSDDMIFNGAYLVKKQHTNDFRNTVARLARHYVEQGFDIVSSGPWPPYHFVNELD